MTMITLQVAQRLVDLATQKATADYGRPICVAVCDPSGFLLSFARMDGSPVRSVAISQGKAYTAARMGVSTDAFLERLHREQILASDFCDPQLTGLPGGAVLKDAAGATVGAIGVSGLAASEDQAISNAMAEHVAAGTL